MWNTQLAARFAVELRIGFILDRRSKNNFLYTHSIPTYVCFRFLSSFDNYLSWAHRLISFKNVGIIEDIIMHHVSSPQCKHSHHVEAAVRERI